MIAFFCLLLAALAATPSADELLAAIDKNMTFDTRSARLQMTVTKNSRAKTYEMQSFSRGADEAAIEFIAPARDQGTKILKRAGEMWMYLPSVEKVQKLSGHMLRQGLMGSDLSYEDLMEVSSLKQKYTARVVGEETMNGRPCYKMELIARDNTVAYPKRVSWIDKEYRVPVQEELYALSGMLLKRWTMSDVKDFSGRKFPTRMVVQDKLQAGSETVVVFSSIQFSVALQEEVFSQRWLER